MQVALAPAISGSGRLHVEPLAAAPELPARTASRLTAAFARGAAQGLLTLAADELETELPPAWAYFRDLSRSYLARALALPEAEQRADTLSVPAPEAELAALAEAAPPILGAERLTPTLLAALWDGLEEALVAELRAAKQTLQAWLGARSPGWSGVGRVTFHLAENPDDAEFPFAFLATYPARIVRGGRVQHRPLLHAVEESSRSGDRTLLRALLVPVQRAAAASELIRALYDSSDLFQPLAWSADEAHRFLTEVPALEAAGVVVRVPDWWRSKRPPRVEVGVTIGKRQRQTLSAESLLDFQVALTLDGEALTAAEARALLEGASGLAFVRGRWVELDRERLRAVLQHWEAAQAEVDEGLTFADAMRLIAGAPASDAVPVPPDAAEWTRVIAGDWLQSVLAGLRRPDALAPIEPGGDGARALQATLRPYQRTGVSWLDHGASLGLGLCLADDMGLGKTLQVIALLLLRRARGKRSPSLIVVPASLLENWRAELTRFAPSLRVLLVHGSVMDADELATAEARLGQTDVVLTSYGMLPRVPWIGPRMWDLVVIDEAQAIKNAGTRQARAVKSLTALARVALTGTPVENRLADLWSIFDFLNPGLLGSAKGFGKLVKRLEARPHDAYGPLRALIRPYLLRRLKTDAKVISDLPAKTELRVFCPLSKVQAMLYQRAVDELAAGLGQAQGIRRRGMVLATLTRLKQICNHPSQHLRDDGWAEAASGKFGRLRELVEEIAARQEKVLVFTQFREVTEPLARFLGELFGRPGLVLSGATSLAERKKRVARFQADDEVPFFVLSLRAGGTGLNLTAASHVIHFDRWWNPAVEEQATDRAFRIGQQRNVLVHKLVCRGTIEDKLDVLIESKRALSKELIEAGGEAVLTELPDDELLRMLSLDLSRALETQ